MLACTSALTLAGCVDILGDFRTTGCATADCAIWAMRFGDADEQVASGVAVAPNDDILLLSTAAGAIDFGDGTVKSAGSTDVFLTRFDAGGALLWSKHFRGTGADYGHAIALDPSGNILVAGSFDGTIDFGGDPFLSAGDKDVFVAKLSPEGDVLWANHYGDAGIQAARAVASDAAGNVLITGCTTDNLAVGDIQLWSTTSDPFVIKLDAGGTPIWAVSAAGAGSTDCGSRIAADAAGDVLVVGDFSTDITFAGDQTHVSAGNSDVFLAKLSSGDGSIVWSRRYGGVGADVPGGLLVTPAGRVVLAGTFEDTVDFGPPAPLTVAGNSDLFVAILQPSGDTLRSVRVGGAQPDHLASAALDGQGDILLSGSTGPGGADIDVYAAKMGQNGDLLWSRVWQAAGSQEATAVAVDSNDITVLAGSLSGTLAIGGHSLQSAGGKDAFLARLGPDSAAPE